MRSKECGVLASWIEKQNPEKAKLVSWDAEKSGFKI